MACNNAFCIWIWEHYTLIIRAWGILTAVVTWAIGIDLCTSVKPWVGAYLVFVAVVLTLLEGAFLIGSCLDKCCNINNCCGKFWACLRWFDNWKRGGLYIVLSIVIWIHPGTNYICGSLVLSLGILYSVHTLYESTVKEIESQREEYQSLENI
ncbi:uncharacterized protein [Antedon mediterranea]|uniref:uncharacterized protein isoform X2 n=1 Tax=Antedon mediterranea TaxID=105859 RepID=UPI003AF8FEE7